MPSYYPPQGIMGMPIGGMPPQGVKRLLIAPPPPSPPPPPPYAEKTYTFEESLEDWTYRQDEGSISGELRRTTGGYESSYKATIHTIGGTWNGYSSAYHTEDIPLDETLEIDLWVYIHSDFPFYYFYVKFSDGKEIWYRFNASAYGDPPSETSTRKIVNKYDFDSDVWSHIELLNGLILNDYKTTWGEPTTDVKLVEIGVIMYSTYGSDVSEADRVSFDTVHLKYKA